MLCKECGYVQKRTLQVTVTGAEALKLVIFAVSP